MEIFAVHQKGVLARHRDKVYSIERRRDGKFAWCVYEDGAHGRFDWENFDDIGGGEVDCREDKTIESETEAEMELSDLVAKTLDDFYRKELKAACAFVKREGLV